MINQYIYYRFYHDFVYASIRIPNTIYRDDGIESIDRGETQYIEVGGGVGLVNKDKCMVTC